MSRDCRIRYIITVNALKEGWDCPFAYILATVANRNSTVDVEQILGRVLRLPYTKASKEKELNLSYAITSSTDFYGTLDKVVKGLNNAGFSKKDYMVKDLEAETVTPKDSEPEQIQITMDDFAFGEETVETDIVVNTADLKAQLEGILNPENGADENAGEIKDTVDSMIETALTENEVYWENISNEDDEQYEDIPDEVVSKMSMYHLKKEFEEDIKKLRIPQFVMEGDASLFSELEFELLERVCEKDLPSKTRTRR